MENKTKYIIGEEVIFASSGASKGPEKGDKGKVIVVRPQFDLRKYLVEFYIERTGLHDGNNRGGKGKSKRCWWCTVKEVLNKEDYLDLGLRGGLTNEV